MFLLVLTWCINIIEIWNCKPRKFLKYVISDLEFGVLTLIQRCYNYCMNYKSERYALPSKNVWTENCLLLWYIIERIVWFGKQESCDHWQHLWIFPAENNNKQTNIKCIEGCKLWNRLLCFGETSLWHRNHGSILHNHFKITET